MNLREDIPRRSPGRERASPFRFRPEFLGAPFVNSRRGFSTISYAAASVVKSPNFLSRAPHSLHRAAHSSGRGGRAIGTGSTACTEHPTALAGSRSEFHIPSSRFSFTLRHSVALYAKPTNKHMRSRPWSLQAQYRSRIATFYKGLVVGLGDGFIDEELSAAHHKDDARNYEQPRT